MRLCASQLSLHDTSKHPSRSYYHQTAFLRHIASVNPTAEGFPENQKTTKKSPPSFQEGFQNLLGSSNECFVMSQRAADPSLELMRALPVEVSVPQSETIQRPPFCCSLANM